MGRLLLRWVLLAVSVIIAAFITDLLFGGKKLVVHDNSVSAFIQLMIGVGLLALLNATLGKILKLLTLPLNCLTLGLFSLVINAIIFMIVASLDLGFTITDSSSFGKFLIAFVASLLVAFISGVLGTFIPDKDQDD